MIYKEDSGRIPKESADGFLITEDYVEPTVEEDDGGRYAVPVVLDLLDIERFRQREEEELITLVQALLMR